MFAMLRCFVEAYASATTGTRFEGLAEAVLRGKESSTFTPSVKSPVVNNWVLACKPQAKECFFNSQKLAMEVDGVTYYEGVFCTAYDPVPVTHAWIEFEGQLYDVTAEAYFRKLKADGAIEADAPEITYYLGIPVQTHGLVYCQHKTGLYRDVLPVLWCAPNNFLGKIKK